MMEELASSLTKGSILIKPKTNQSPRKKKKEPTLSAANYYPKFQKESDRDKLIRYKAYDDCWKSISTQISEIQENDNVKTLEALLDFVASAHIKNNRRSTNFPIAEIPTAGFLTGVNIPDHDVVFSQFKECLDEKVTPYTVILRSKDNTTLKLILQNALDGLTIPNTHQNADDSEGNSDNDDLCENDVEVILNTSKRQKNPHFKDYSFKELVVWYKEKIRLDLHDSSEGQEDSVKPIVFIFEDFESFTSNVLQDFVLIASEYMNELPLVFVFGIATSISAIHKSLPHCVSSRLSIEKFQSQPSLEVLCGIIDKVMLSNKNAFKLGPALLRLLYDRFLFYDLSISNFINALKFSILDHFCVKEFSLLCTFDQEYIKGFIDNLSSNKLKMFREMPSYQRFFDRQSETEQKKLNANEKYFKDTLMKMVEDLQAHEKCFYPVTKCFHQLTVNLYGHPFGKRLQDVYCQATVKHRLSNDNRYTNAIALARMLPRDELLRIVTSSHDILKATVDEFDSDDENNFVDTVSKLAEYQIQFTELEKGTSRYDQQDSSTSAVTPTSSSKLYKSRHEFREQMLSAMKEKRKQSPYDRLRNDVIDTLENIFKSYLISPLILPLHEIFYYNDSFTVKQRIDGSPKEVITKALTSPQTYLKCKCCKSSSDGVDSSQPDVAIHYQLHLECGKLINLYDWLQTFMVLIEPSLNNDTKKKKKTKKQQKLEEQLQARFIRSVSELQHMGFIKSTKKKTDHVSRLTWGGC